MPKLSKYIKIFLEHYNAFDETFQQDLDADKILTDRSLETQTVINDPCAGHWTSKPPPWRRKHKNVPLPSKTTPAFDDEFQTIAEEWAAVIDLINECE